MKKVATSVSGGVAHVILNNPDRHNAFDDQIIASLLESFVSVAGNPEVRVMVLKSVGKNFSAGADLNWMKRMAGYSFQENLFLNLIILLVEEHLDLYLHHQNNLCLFVI